MKWTKKQNENNTTSFVSKTGEIIINMKDRTITAINDHGFHQVLKIPKYKRIEKINQQVAIAAVMLDAMA